jgi:hypothetical protein
MNNESIKLALEKWAKDKGYESFSKILPCAPEIFNGLEEDLKNEGVFFLLRPSSIEKFSQDREYFTKNGDKAIRRKIPKERDYLIASWASPSGLSQWVRGGLGNIIDFKTEGELVNKVELGYGLLNRDSVFYPAIMEWLGKMNRNYSQAERIDWPTVFEDPKDLIVPFDDWAFVEFTVQGEWEKETKYLGVTNCGRLGLFEAKGGLYLIAPLVENLQSGDEVFQVLENMKEDSLIASPTNPEYLDDEEGEE